MSLLPEPWLLCFLSLLPMAQPLVTILPFSVPCSFSSLKHPSTFPPNPGASYCFCHCSSAWQYKERPPESRSGRWTWPPDHLSSRQPPTQLSPHPYFQLRLLLNSSLECNHRTLDPIVTDHHRCLCGPELARCLLASSFPISFQLDARPLPALSSNAGCQVLVGFQHQ